MPRLQTRLQLRTRCRQRADMVSSPFVSDAEINSLMSEHYSWLFELLVQSGLNYFEEEVAISGTGAEKYNLPANFFGTVAVDYRYSATQHAPLVEYMAKERTLYENLTSGLGQPMAYAILGTQGAAAASANQISLLPALQSGQVVRVRFVPMPISLEDSGGATDGTTVDGVSGWEELIVVKTAIDMLTKEESSTTALERREMNLIARIESAAELRAWTTPRRVVDTRGIYEGVLHRGSFPA